MHGFLVYLEAEFEKGDYNKAFDNYRKSATILTKAVSAIEHTLETGSSITIVTKLDGDIKINPRELLYYSLYNMACCKTRLHDFSQTRRFLYYAVLAGWLFWVLPAFGSLRSQNAGRAFRGSAVAPFLVRQSRTSNASRHYNP